MEAWRPSGRTTERDHNPWNILSDTRHIGAWVILSDSSPCSFRLPWGREWSLSAFLSPSPTALIEHSQEAAGREKLTRQKVSSAPLSKGKLFMKLILLDISTMYLHTDADFYANK